MTDRVELQFVSDTSGVDQGFDKVDRGLNSLDGQLRQASNGVTSFFTIFAGSLGAGLAIGAIESIGDAISSLPDLVQRGAGIDDITASFEDLSAKAGSVGSVLLNDLSSALGGTIPKLDLMKQSNELLIAGLDPDDFSIVAKAARSLGEATGVSAKEGMEKLSDSLLRGNDRALKSLGIILDLDKVQISFAETLGKTKDQLTENEKAEANRAATIDALKKKTGELTEVTDDSGDIIDQIAASLQNQADEALRAIGTNEDLKSALEGLRGVLNNIDFTSLISGLTQIISLTAQAVSGFIAFAQGTSSIQQKVATLSGEYKVMDAELTKIVESMDGTKESTVRATKAYNDLVDVANQTNLNPTVAAALKKDFDFVGGQLNELNQKYGTLSKTTLPKVQEEVKKTGEVIRNLGKEKKDATDRTKEIEDFTKKYADAIKREKEELVKLTIESGSYSKILDEVETGTINSQAAGEKIEDLYQRIKDALNESNIASQLYTAALAKIGSGANIAADDLAKLAQDAEKAKQELDSLTKSKDNLSDKTNLGINLGSLEQDLAGALGQALSDVLDGKSIRDSISGIGASLGQSLGASVGASLGGPVGAAIGGELGQAIGDKVFEKISKIGTSAKGSRQGTRLLLDAMFPGFGTIADEFFGDKLFAGDSKGTETRKAIDKFFGEAFDANRIRVIIDGQLKQLEDFDFGGGLFGTAESKASQFFNTLSSDSQAAFGNVATGFTALLGIGTEASAGLAQVLANELGGSLNNLQLLVEGMGLSFEEMKTQVVDAFLEGKLSALEAQSALQGIAQISQKGIPDGIGMVAKAFDNIKAAGVKGGRALIDALQDVGFEAKELGDNTLEQVMQRLKNTAGVSAEEVDKVFNALKKSGITTLDQLTNATAEQLLPALADLENTKFPFAEAAKDARDYVEAIDRIPEQKNIQLNLKVNYQNSADSKVVQELAGRGELGRGEATR